MTDSHPTETRPQASADWGTMMILSLTSPLIAAGVQSVWVFWRGYWVYQAMIGGAFFHPVENPVTITLVCVPVACGVMAAPTYLLLLPFRRRTVYRWLAWICSIVFWTWYFFKHRTGLQMTVHKVWPT